MKNTINILFITLILQMLTACAQTKFDLLSNEEKCSNLPPANIGEKVEFTFLIKDIKLKTLHIDFIDNSYGYFNSLILKVEAPFSWSNEIIEMYYQGVPRYKDKVLKIGERFKFIEEVPHCLDSEWLFLRR